MFDSSQNYKLQTGAKISNTFFQIHMAGFPGTSVGLAWLAELGASTNEGSERGRVGGWRWAPPRRARMRRPVATAGPWAQVWDVDVAEGATAKAGDDADGGQKRSSKEKEIEEHERGGRNMPAEWTALGQGTVCMPKTCFIA